MKLFACASRVVRIVSLDKKFLDEIKECRGKEVLFNSARGQNSTNQRAVRGSLSNTVCLRRLMEKIKMHR